MKKTIVSVILLLGLASCSSKESDELTEIEIKSISQELFLTSSFPSVVTEPYISVSTHLDLSKLPDGLTGTFCTQEYDFEELGMTISGLDNDVSTGQDVFRLKYCGLHNHTTGIYKVGLFTKDKSNDNGYYFTAEPIRFRVEIDEQSLAETLPVVEELTTNEVTLEAQMNITPAYSDKFDYHIYCDTEPDDVIFKNRLASRCEMTPDGHVSVTYKGLRFGTRYHYMACIHNANRNYRREECYCGAVLTFDVPAMQAEVITGDAPATIDLNWLQLPFRVKGINVSTRSLSVGICYSTTRHEPTFQDEHEEFFITDGSGIVNIIDLSPNMTYYYRAFAKYNYSYNTDTDCTIIYGDVKSFTTPGK